MPARQRICKHNNTCLKRPLSRFLLSDLRTRALQQRMHRRTAMSEMWKKVTAGGSVSIVSCAGPEASSHQSKTFPNGLACSLLLRLKLRRPRLVTSANSTNMMSGL